MTLSFLQKQLAAAQAEHQNLTRDTYRCEGAILLLQHLIKQRTEPKAKKV